MKQNLETIIDTKENYVKSESSDDDLRMEETNNIIQFEQFKKLDK